MSSFKVNEKAWEKEQAVTRNAVDGLQLSHDEAFPNANLVYNWFVWLESGIGVRWDDMSVAGVLGNMYLESRLNPESGAGYTKPPWDLSRQGGLVQWNPSRKMIDWCFANGMDGYRLQSQCKRITFEYQNPLEAWLRVTPVSFENFAAGNYTPHTVDRAAEIWALNYERNAGADLDIRQLYARQWFAEIPNFFEIIGFPPWLVGVIRLRRYASYD